jgi:hypothetical protein
MNYTTDIIEQAKIIVKDGCQELNCNTCHFINGICRISKSFQSMDEDVIYAAKELLRVKKLENILK